MLAVVFNTRSELMGCILATCPISIHLRTYNVTRCQLDLNLSVKKCFGSLITTTQDINLVSVMQVFFVSRPNVLCCCLKCFTCSHTIFLRVWTLEITLNNRIKTISSCHININMPFWRAEVQGCGFWTFCPNSFRCMSFVTANFWRGRHSQCILKVSRATQSDINRLEQVNTVHVTGVQ